MASYEKYEKIRNSKGLTDYAVHKATGIATATISDWKNGKSNPKTDKLIAIAECLGVKINDLIE